MTNVRLDSFVYTVEGFRDAVQHLSSDGLLVVSYLVLDRAQGDKLFAMLKKAAPEQTPRAFTAGKYGGITFVTGPGLDACPRALPASPKTPALSCSGSIRPRSPPTTGRSST